MEGACLVTVVHGMDAAGVGIEGDASHLHLVGIPEIALAVYQTATYQRAEFGVRLVEIFIIGAQAVGLTVIPAETAVVRNNPERALRVFKKGVPAGIVRVRHIFRRGLIVILTAVGGIDAIDTRLVCEDPPLAMAVASDTLGTRLRIEPFLQVDGNRALALGEIKHDATAATGSQCVVPQRLQVVQLSAGSG